MRRRKSSGPQRSSSPLDDYLHPGIIFKIASNGRAHLCPGAVGWRLRSAGESFDSRPSSPSDSGREEALVDNSSGFLWLTSETNTSGAGDAGCTNADTSGDSLSSFSAASSNRKKCASCSARKTPYWREGWSEGVLLCNACGIRFHKYRKYCLKCSCIAKKDEQGRLQCPKCLFKL
jgi:hypothetical protein